MLGMLSRSQQLVVRSLAKYYWEGSNWPYFGPNRSDNAYSDDSLWRSFVVTLRLVDNSDPGKKVDGWKQQLSSSGLPSHQ